MVNGGNWSPSSVTDSPKDRVREGGDEQRQEAIPGWKADVENSIDVSTFVKPPPNKAFAETPKRSSEIDPSLYSAPVQGEQVQPIVHSFSLHNRPVGCRRRIGVTEVFSHPVNLIWKNKFKLFNCIQSEMANVLAHSNDAVLVSAPTGAGKTALFEMAMARHIMTDLEARREPNGSLPRHLPRGRKIVYIAPSKALCDERYEDWCKRLSTCGIGIQCAMITGDAEAGECFRDLAAAHVVLTTPEKWDSLTRRWNENFFLFASVKLLLLDEVHLLADESRGVCLEATVCRMKTIVRASQSKRFTVQEIQATSG